MEMTWVFFKIRTQNHCQYTLTLIVGILIMHRCPKKAWKSPRAKPVSVYQSGIKSGGQCDFSTSIHALSTSGILHVKSGGKRDSCTQYGYIKNSIVKLGDFAASFAASIWCLFTVLIPAQRKNFASLGD